MSDSLRLRGQEVQVRIIRGGVIERTVTAVKSLMVTLNLTATAEGYAGETTDRMDDMFHGASVEMLVHPEDAAILRISQAVVDRASRRTAQANTHIDVVATLSFPNGDRPKVTIPDVKFNDIPLNLVAARDQYSDVRLSGKSDRVTFAGL